MMTMVIVMGSAIMRDMKIVDMERTGENLYHQMKEKNITAHDAMAILGFTTPNPIYKYWRGECLPRIDNLVILSSLLGIKLDDLIATKELEK